MTDVDCSTDGTLGCAFLISHGCSGTGTCMAKAKLLSCRPSTNPWCACDHTDVDVDCSPYPTGYATKPLTGDQGPCPHSIPAQPCTTSKDCSAGWECGFSEGAGCDAKGTCWNTSGQALCNAFSPGCACDGTTINIICNGLPDGIAPKPLAYKGQCTAVDAGP
jgi:hypothetical protein